MYMAWWTGQTGRLPTGGWLRGLLYGTRGRLPRAAGWSGSSPVMYAHGVVVSERPPGITMCWTLEEIGNDGQSWRMVWMLAFELRIILLCC